MILFYYGTDHFTPERAIRELKERYLSKNPSGAGLQIFDCASDVTLAQIEASFGTQNLFAAHQLIIVQDFFQNFPADEQRLLRDTLAAGASDDVLVLWERGMPRKNAALFTWLTKNAKTVTESALPEGAALDHWVQVEVTARGASIAAGAARDLSVAVGSDLHRLDQEIEKLIAHADGVEISSEHVKKLVAGRVDGDIFGAVEALVGGNPAVALRQLRTQVRAGDDVHYLFSMYVYQIRTLLTVSSFYHGQNISDKGMIAKQAKLHPFVVQKSLGVLQKMTSAQLRAAHRSLTEIDRSVKIGQRDMATALEMFVMEVSAR